MNQEQLTKILAMIGELTVNLRFANEEIDRLKKQVEALTPAPEPHRD